MVDNISKPFTFTANTYAKASEVNADFDTLYTGVNACVNQINANIADINNLDTNKADVNGNSTQRFSVADPTVNTDAVNKQSLMKYIGNSLDYISGLIISKDSSSPNDTIIVSPGSCYDSTKNTMLVLQNNTIKQNENQGANTTYYVYIIGNSTGSLTDILISTSSTTPALPTGYTLFRQIGNYTTNSNNRIENVYSSSNSVTPADILNSANGLMPDYTAGIECGNPVSGSPYVAPANGIFVFLGGTNNADRRLYINGVKTAFGTHDSADGRADQCLTVPLSKGDSVYWDSAQGTIYVCEFYPYKGV